MSRALNSALEFLKRGRDLIVNAFADVTTDLAHQFWEKTRVNGIIIGAVVGSPAFQPPGAVHPFHSPNARTLITERPALWRGPTVARLDYLCRLPVGWNGYRAGPVSFNVAHFALRLLDAVCGPETPAPSSFLDHQEIFR